MEVEGVRVGLEVFQEMFKVFLRYFEVFLVVVLGVCF